MKRPPASTRNRPSAQTVEHVRECRGLGLLEIDGLADEHRAAHVRAQRAPGAAHRVVDHAARVITRHAEIRTAARRLVEHRDRDVDPTLRPSPLPVEAAAAKLVVGHEVRNTDDRADLAGRRRRHRAELRIRLRVELHVVRIAAGVTMGADAILRRILHEKPADLTVHEISNLRENVRPQRGFERSVIGVRDDSSQFLGFAHGVAHKVVKIERSSTLFNGANYRHLDLRLRSPSGALEKSSMVKPVTCDDGKSVYISRNYTDRFRRSWAGAQSNWSRVQHASRSSDSNGPPPRMGERLSGPPTRPPSASVLRTGATWCVGRSSTCRSNPRPSAFPLACPRAAPARSVSQRPRLPEATELVRNHRDIASASPDHYSIFLQLSGRTVVHQNDRYNCDRMPTTSRFRWTAPDPRRDFMTGAGPWP